MPKEGRNVDFMHNRKNMDLSEAAEKNANSKDTTITAVSLAWSMRKALYLYPSLSGREMSHWKRTLRLLVFT